MSNNCGIFWPEKFNGNEKNLKSFLIQFEIACQINKWENHKQPFWFIQCIEGPALQWICKDSMQMSQRLCSNIT